MNRPTDIRIAPCPQLVVRCISFGLLGALLGSVAVATAAAPAGKAPTEALAQFVIATAGTSGGLCALPRCDDAELAVELAQAGKYFVHVAHPDAKSVQRVVDAALARKMIGRDIVAETGSLRRIVFADCYVNALLIADFSAADLKSVSPAEIVRVLAPHGTAIIGKAKSKGAADVTAQQLVAWARKAEVDASPLDNALGVWVVLTKPALPGSDNWSHWNHGPDNNPVSADTARTWPSMVQWFGRPYNREREGFLLAARGRIFTASKPIPGYARPESPVGDVFAGDLLVVRDACNGRVLWSRKLTGEPPYLLPAWIATDDRFVMPVGATAMALDAATGKEMERHVLGAEPEEIIWMCVEEGTLYAMLHDKPAPNKRPRGTAAEKEAAILGTRLVAWDLKQRKPRWQATAKSPIDARAIAISNGRLFAYSPGQSVTAFDVANGTPAWTCDDAQLLGSMKKTLLDGNSSVDGITLFRAGLIASPKAVVVNLNSRESRVVFDANTGKMLWDSKLHGGNGGRGGSMVIVGDRLLAKGMTGAIRGMQNGEEIKEVLQLGGGCGRFIATPKGIVGMFDEFCAFDGDKRSQERSLLKPECHIGTIVANGLTFTPPGSCRCAMPLRGFIAQCSRPTDLAIVPDDQRLETFAGATTQAAAATDRDWPVFRGSDEHGSSSKTPIGKTPLSQKWLSEPCGAGPTPPIAVGDRVYVAGDDGVIRCFDATSGKPSWQFATAGRIRVAPTYSEGRIYAGSADGFVYCLSADSGRPFWRFLAAPTTRRIMVLDRLSSTWPVNSGVIVRDGVAFAMAGFSDREGMHVWALDARTGQPRWHNDKLSELGVMPMGNMTIAGQHLWLRTDAGMPALDLKTGELAAQPQIKPGRRGELAPSVRGGEIGVLDGRFIIQGGFRQFSDQWERTLGRGQNIALIVTDDRGVGKYPMFRPLGECALLPVWDAKLMLVSREQFRKAKKLEAWDTAKLAAWTKAELAKAEPNLAKMHVAEVQGKSAESPVLAWGPVDHDINAAVLAPDAIAIAEGTHTAKAVWVPDGWQVAVLDRDGKALWQSPLPAEPIYDGLCVDRQGRLIVTMTDGSIACFGK